MSESNDAREQQTDQEREHERRLDALRGIATEQQQSGMSSAVGADRPSNPRGGIISLPSAAPQSLWRRWQLWLAVLVVLGFGALVLTRIVPAAPHQTTQRLQPVTISPLESLLQCPRDIAWSPDGREIAVLATPRRVPAPSRM
jgi:hypothetical protein